VTPAKALRNPQRRARASPAKHRPTWRAKKPGPQNRLSGMVPTQEPSTTEAPPRAVSPQEWDLVQQLRMGDEAAFRRLAERYHASMVRLAAAHTPSRAIAEEVVQEAWIGILKALDGFEGRSSLRAWMFRIVANTAKLRGTREARSSPFSALEEEGGPSVSADSFRPENDPRWAGHWAWSSAPTPWPDDQLSAQQTKAYVMELLRRLPPRQREVMTLRDIEGCSAAEVCEALGVTDDNQRVLLHRARSKVRAGLVELFSARRASA